MDERNWEYQESGPQETPKIAGKIHERSEFSQSTLKPSSYVTNIVKNKYALPFVRECPPCFARNNKSSLRNRDFVENAIEDLLKSRCIQEVDKKPYCCNPLTVSESEKLRLVLDLRHVNPYLETYKFKYEDLKTVQEILNKGFTLPGSISKVGITILVSIPNT